MVISVWPETFKINEFLTKYFLHFLFFPIFRVGGYGGVLQIAVKLADAFKFMHVATCEHTEVAWALP